MYESFFGLTRRPFAFIPQVNQFYPGRAIEAARQTLVRCIERAEGIGAVIGPAGTGKSLLLQVLASRFRGQFSVALLANSHLSSRRGLLQAILFELGLPYRGLDEGELRLSLLDHIGDGESNGLLLLIDEAQQLPLRLIEEVRMIAGLVRHGQPQVRLILAGSASLEERLASPKLAAFTQRLSARCYLEPFDISETIAYIRSQFSTAGGSSASIMTDSAMESVFRATDGIPRLVNQLCDHALVLAYAGGHRIIDVAGIEEAWSDLQQLPTPWNETTRFDAVPAANSEAIEFGVLDEQTDREVEPQTRLRISEHETSHEDLDFDPVSNRQPEVELVVAQTSDPFAESFVEEEVIMNPYASIDETRIARTRVSSTEGQKIAAMLEPFLGESTSGISSPSITLPAPLVTGPSHVLVDSISPAIESAIDSVNASSWAISSAPLGGEVHWFEPNLSHPGMVKFQSESSAISSSSEDRDMMIVDEASEISLPVRKQGPVAQRQEYRQLFAQLRRG